MRFVIVTGMSGAGKSTALNYLEDAEYTMEEYGLILLCLEKRGLISLDYDKPLKSFDDGAYARWTAPFRRSTRSRSASISAAALMKRRSVRPFRICRTWGSALRSSSSTPPMRCC